MTSPWLRNLLPRPSASHRLVIVPHAGGGPAFYRHWVKQLPTDVEPWAALLPGRESRWKEPPLRRMEPLVDALCDALTPFTDKPLRLYGHSLGAIVAYELARKLRHVEKLVVAGARAPQLPRNRTLMHGLTETTLRAELVRLGGTPTEVLDNEELFGLFLPTLRADLEVFETYEHRTGEPLAIPLRVMGGFTDERTPLRDLLPWRDLTTNTCEISAHIGGHFFAHSAGYDPVPADRLHIIGLDQPAEPFWELLDENERERAKRFLKLELRHRFIVSHGAMRKALGSCRLRLSASGKPEPENGPTRFNLSHSDNLAVLAITDRQEIGIDLEQMRTTVDHAGLAARYFAPKERDDVLAQTDKTTRFFAYWTGKEAYSKARGLGLNLPLDGYDIQLDERGYPCGVTDRTAPPWHVAGLNVADGFAAAIASERLITGLQIL